jgi:tape measure domain-containing protein
MSGGLDGVIRIDAELNTLTLNQQLDLVAKNVKPIPIKVVVAGETMKSLETFINTANRSIKPKIDQSEYHDFNRTIQSKINHLGEFRRVAGNPIKPRIDDSDLVAAEKVLNSIDRKMAAIRSGQNIVISATVNYSEIQKSISTEIENGFSKVDGKKVFSSLLSPFSSILRGAFEGIGRDATKELSKGFAGGIGQILSPYIGSGELVGEKLAGALGNKIGKSIRASVKAELKSIADDVRVAIGEVDVDRIAGNARATRRQLQQRQSKSAAEQFNVERQDYQAEVYRQQEIAQQQADRAKRVKERVKPAFDRIAQTIEVKEFELKAENLSLKEQYKISRSIDRTRKYVEYSDKLSVELAELEASSLKVQAQIDKAKSRYKDISTRIDALTPEVPIGLAQIAKMVTGQDVPASKLPRIIEADAKLAKDGAVASYSAQANALLVKRELAQQLRQGGVTDQNVIAGVHEFRHAQDLGYGSIQGVRANRRNEILIPRQYSAAEVAYAAPSLAKYRPEDRAVEMSAYAAEYSVALPYLKQQREKREAEALFNQFGFGGGTYKNVMQSESARTLEGLGGLAKQKADPRLVTFLTDNALSVKSRVDATREVLLDASVSGRVAEGTVERLTQKVQQQLQDVEKLQRAIARVATNTEAAQNYRRVDPADDAWSDNRRSPSANRFGSVYDGRKSTKFGSKYQGKAESPWAQAELVTVETEPVTFQNIGNALKLAAHQVGQVANVAGRALAPVAPILSRGINAARQGYQIAHGVEQGLFRLAPWNEANIAKTAIQGAATFGLMHSASPEMVDAALVGGKSLIHNPLVQQGAHFLADKAFGWGGNAVAGGLTTASEFLLPVALGKATVAAAGSVVDRVADGSKHLDQKALSMGQDLGGKVIAGANKAINAAASSVSVEYSPLSQLGGVAAAALPPAADELSAMVVGGIDKARTAPGKRNKKWAERVGNNITRGYEAIDRAIASGDIDVARYIADQLATRADAAIEDIRGVYQKFGKGSQQRKDLGAINRDIGNKRRLAEEKLKKIEQIPDEELRQKKTSSSPLPGESQGDFANRLSQALNEKISSYGAVFGAVEGSISSQEIQNKITAVQNGLSGGSGKLITLIKGAFTGYVGLMIAQVVGGAVLGISKQAIDLAIKDANTNLALRSTTTASQFDSINSSSTELAKKLGISQLDTKSSIGGLAASILDTPLEGQAGFIGSGLAKFGRARGVDSEKLRRAQVAISQMAGKGQLYAEEVFGQLAEALPGGAVELAASSGLTVKQLRALMKRGGADATSTLTRFAGRINAVGDSELQGFEGTPQARLGNFQNSVEQFQLKVGQDLLAPISTGAGVASGAIDLLTRNFDTLLKLIMAGIVAQALPMIIKFRTEIAALGGIDLRGTLSGLRGIAESFAVNAGLAVGITMLAESIGSFADSFTGASAPSKKFADDMERAYQAVKGINKERPNSGNARDSFYEDKKNFTDKAFDAIDAVNPFIYLSRGVTNPNTSQYRSTERRAIDDAAKLREGAESAKKLAEAAKTPVVSPAETQRLAQLNAKMIQLKSEEALATGLDPAVLKRNQEQQQAINAASSDIVYKIQQRKSEIDRAIKDNEDKINNPFYANDPRTKPIIDDLIKTTPLLRTESEKLAKVLSEQTTEATKAAEAIVKMNSNISAARFQSDRTFNAESLSVITNFSGSLQTGLRATKQYAIEQAKLNRELEIAQQDVANSKKAIQLDPEARGQVGAAQASGKLPSDLTAVTEEEIKYLTEQGAISKGTAEKINRLRSAGLNLEKALTAQQSAIDNRNKALAEEAKATREYFINTTSQLKINQLAAEEQTRSLKQQEYSSKFKSAISGFNSTLSTYIGSLLDVFTNLSEITTINSNYMQKNLELQLKYFQNQAEFQNRQNASSNPGAPAATTGFVDQPLTVISGGRQVKRFEDINKHHRNGKAYLDEGGQIWRSNGKSRMLVKDVVLSLNGNTSVPVPAMTSGIARVLDEGKGKGYGQYVEILDEKGNVLARQAHLNRVDARTGQFVLQGQSIGIQGSTGRSTGIHLHGEASEAIWREYFQGLRTGQWARPAVPMSSSGGSGQPGNFLSTAPVGGIQKGLLKGVSNVIARYESGSKGYYADNSGGTFPQSEAAKGFPASQISKRMIYGSVKSPDIGRYQFRKADYDWARSLDPSINNFLPESQDKIMFLKITRGGRGGKELLEFQKNPTLENAIKVRRALGNEWEAFRDGTVLYGGKNVQQNSKGRRGNTFYDGGRGGMRPAPAGSNLFNVWGSLGGDDHQFYQQLRRSLGMAVSMVDDFGVLVASAGVSDVPMNLGLIAGNPNSNDKGGYNWGGSFTRPAGGTAPSPDKPTPKIINIPRGKTSPIEFNAGRLIAVSDEVQWLIETFPWAYEGTPIRDRTGKIVRRADKPGTFLSRVKEGREFTTITIDSIKRKAAIGSGGLTSTPTIAGAGVIKGSDRTMPYGPPSPVKYGPPPPPKKEMVAPDIAAPTEQQLQEMQTYQGQQDAVRRQIQGNAENAQSQVNTVYFNQRAALRAAELNKRRGEFQGADNRLAAERSAEDAQLEGIPDSQQKKYRARVIAIERKIQDAERKQAQDVEMEDLEIQQLTELLADLKKLPLDGMEPNKRAVLEKMIAETPAGITRMRDNRKKLNESLKKLQTAYAAQLNLAKKEKGDEDAALLAEANIKINQAEIDRLESSAKKLDAYLAKNPYDFSKGDPLTLRRDAAVLSARNTLIAKLAQVKKERVGLDPKLPVDAKRLEALGKEESASYEVYNNTLEALKQQYIVDVTNRNNDINKYLQDLGDQKVQANLGIISARQSLEAARGETYKAYLSGTSVAEGQRQLKLGQTLSELDRAALKDPKRLGGKVLEEARNAATLTSTLEKQAADESIKRERLDRLFGLGQGLGNAQVETLRGRGSLMQAQGNSFDAQEQNRLAAYYSERLAIMSKLEEFRKLELANAGDPAAVNQIKLMREEFEKLSAIKLESLNLEFNKFKGILTETTSAGQNIIQKMFTGQGGAQDWNNLLAAPFKGITDALSNQMGSMWAKIVDGVFGGITTQLNGQMSNSRRSQGNDLGGIFGSLINGIGSLFGGGGGGSGINYKPAHNMAPKFADGGVLNPHLPVSAIDNRLIMARDGEGILVPEAVRAMGGKVAIDALNSRAKFGGAFARGGVVGMLAAPMPMPSGSPALSNNIIPTGRKVEVTYIQGSDGMQFVTMSEHQKAMAAMEYNQGRAFRDYEDYQQDRATHSIAYRSGRRY